MVKRTVRVVLDTNVLISAVIFDGKPRRVLELINRKEIIGISSAVLMAELVGVLAEKFAYPLSQLIQIERKMKKNLKIVYPEKTIYTIENDIDDNRVLEAAVKGDCNYVVTGDNHLLTLGGYEDITILTSREFLQTEVWKGK